MKSASLALLSLAAVPLALRFTRRLQTVTVMRDYGLEPPDTLHEGPSP